MPYKPEPPPDKGNFAKTVDSSRPCSFHKTGCAGYEAVDRIIDDRTIAVLIDSAVLGAPVWFSFSADFDPGDGIPVFYADELCFLKDKPISTLRKIYESKKTFGPGTRVRQ